MVKANKRSHHPAPFPQTTQHPTRPRITRPHLRTATTHPTPHLPAHTLQPLDAYPAGSTCRDSSHIHNQTTASSTLSGDLLQTVLPMTGPLRAVRVQDSFHHLPLRGTRWWRRLRFVRPRNTLGSVALPGSASPLCWSYFQGLIHAQILSCIISASATPTSDQRFLPFGSRTTSPRTYIATSAHKTHKHTCLLDHSAARASPYHPLFPAPCFQLPTHTTQSTSKHRKQQPGLQRHHGFSNAMRYL
jgi:hypothetical protein